jgi:hypothetical protein
VHPVLRYCTNVLIGIDQLGTVLVGGWPDETLSSYAYRMDQQGKLSGRVFRPLIDWLFSWQGLAHGHCHQAYLEERLRVEMPPELR